MPRGRRAQKHIASSNRSNPAPRRSGRPSTRAATTASDSLGNRQAPASTGAAREIQPSSHPELGALMEAIRAQVREELEAQSRQGRAASTSGPDGTQAPQSSSIVQEQSATVSGMLQFNIRRMPSAQGLHRLAPSCAAIPVSCN